MQTAAGVAHVGLGLYKRGRCAARTCAKIWLNSSGGNQPVYGPQAHCSSCTVARRSTAARIIVRLQHLPSPGSALSTSAAAASYCWSASLPRFAAGFLLSRGGKKCLCFFGGSYPCSWSPELERLHGGRIAGLNAYDVSSVHFEKARSTAAAGGSDWWRCTYRRRYTTQTLPGDLVLAPPRFFQPFSSPSSAIKN